MRDVYEVQLQRTAGAYRTIQLFFRENDALDFIASIAAMNPDYPYDGKSWAYAVGSSVRRKDRYRIVKNGVLGEKGLTTLKKTVKI